jgi:WD40 repeat protein
LETFLHTEPIKNLLKFNNNIFISFYRNNFVQLWDLSQKLCVKSFYSSDISQNFNCVRFISGIKFVRAHYNYIKIWELGDSNELTLKGHQGMIFDLLILANRKSLVSCSSDKKIKVWNNQGKCIITFKGHKNWILCLVELKNGNLASGSLDKTIKIWNIETKICINTLKGHKRGITILERNIRGVELFSASFEGIIKIWNSDAGVCLKTLDGHNNSISSLVLHSNFLFSCSYDKSIKIWNLDSGECERTLLGHCDIINKLIIF